MQYVMQSRVVSCPMRAVQANPVSEVLWRYHRQRHGPLYSGAEKEEEAQHQDSSLSLVTFTNQRFVFAASAPRAVRWRPVASALA